MSVRPKAPAIRDASPGGAHTGTGLGSSSPP